MAGNLKPYKAESRNGYWVLVDSRTGELASFPTTKANCRAEADMMNRLYVELLAEQSA